MTSTVPSHILEFKEEKKKREEKRLKSKENFRIRHLVFYPGNVTSEEVALTRVFGNF